MKLKSLFLIFVLFTFRLFSEELGYGITEDLNFEFNKFAGELKLELSGEIADDKFSIFLKNDDINGSFNLLNENVSNSNGNFTVLLNNEISDNKNDIEVFEEFKNLINGNTIEIELINFDEIKNFQRQNVIDKLTVEGDMICNITINNETVNKEIPFEMVFLKESDFTKRRTDGHILVIKSDFELNLDDFDVKLPKGSDETLNINFKLSASSLEN